MESLTGVFRDEHLPAFLALSDQFLARDEEGRLIVGGSYLGARIVVEPEITGLTDLDPISQQAPSCR